VFLLSFTALHFYPVFFICPNFRKILKKTVLTEIVKKGKETAEAITSEESDMQPLFSDTTCNKDSGTTSWEAMYNLLEEKKPKAPGN